MRTTLTLIGMLTWVALACGGEASPAGKLAPLDPAAAAGAAEIFKAAGRKQGLCIQLGGDVKLAAALHGGGRWLVVRFTPDAADVTAARKYVRSTGAYGPVSVEKSEFGALPLAVNQANIVAVDDPAKATKAGASAAEILRVLCPNGIVIIKSGPGGAELAKALEVASGAKATAAGAWLRLEKPRPAGYDNWTHPRYAANNCDVSNDKFVGPPQHLQWLAGPVFPARTHGYGTILSAGGRNYYVLTAGQALLPTYSNATVAVDSVAGVPKAKGTRSWLVARDAYNGLPLWRRAYDGSSTTLVVDAQRVYTMIGSTIVALDGATGRAIAAYGKTNYSARARLLLQDGVLIFSGSKSLNAVDTRSGKAMWDAPLPSKAGFLIEGKRVIIFDAAGKKLSALELASGKQAWKVDCSAWMKGRDRMCFGRKGLLVFDALVDRKVMHVTGLSPKDGKMLWTYKYDMVRRNNRRTVRYAGGLVWVQHWMVAGTKNQRWVGLDPTSGKSRRTITTRRTSTYACHSDSATDRHLILNRPADFMAWADGKVSPFRASRPACRQGATLANGLFYSAPNICLCVRGNMHGFVGMAPAPDARPKGESAAAARLERGPAFGKTVAVAAPSAADWPTFRRDPARSAAVPAAKFSPKLKLLWKRQVAKPRTTGPSLLADEALANWTGGDPITAPTVAGGKVFVGLPDGHEVVALDAASGKLAWSALIGGRMDVPPTVHKGLGLVGGRDGWVYALRTSDGALAWRFRAASEERRIVAFGQLESTWPVVGGVLVKDNLAYALTGRSSETDGRVSISCLEPATGKMLWEQCPPTNAKTGFVGLADILVADDKSVACGGGTTYRLDPATGKLLGRKLTGGVRAGTSNGQFYAYIGSSSTLLDRKWHFSTDLRMSSRFQTQWKDGLKGQLVVFDKTRAVGFLRARKGKLITSRIVAQQRVADVRSKQKPKPLWSVEVPKGVAAEALAIVGEYVVVGTASVDRKAGQLLILSMKDGSKLAEYPLPGAIAAEGLAIVGETVYASTWTGEVLCLTPAK